MGVDWYYDVPLKTIFSTLYLDFYLPIFKIAIEFDGIQHYKEASYFSDTLDQRKMRDKRKEKLLDGLKIRLIRISYKDKVNLSSLTKLLMED